MLEIAWTVNVWTIRRIFAILFVGLLSIPVSLCRHHARHLCSPCPAGFFVSKRCSDPTQGDTECTPCPLGSFRDGPSWHPTQCRPCSHCGTGLYVAHPCTPSKDTVCDQCATYRGPHNRNYHSRCVLGLPGPDLELATSGDSFLEVEDFVTGVMRQYGRHFSDNNKDGNLENVVPSPEIVINTSQLVRDSSQTSSISDSSDSHVGILSTSGPRSAALVVSSVVAACVLLIATLLVLNRIHRTRKLKLKCPKYMYHIVALNDENITEATPL